MYKLNKLHTVPTLEAPRQLAGESPTNTTENQTVAIIMRNDLLPETLTLDLPILSADVSLPTVGIVIYLVHLFLIKSITISSPAAEEPSFIAADNTNLEILGQSAISFIQKDETYTCSVYVVNNLVTDVIFWLDFLSFNEAQVDLIDCSIHFVKPNTCHIGSCRKPVWFYLQFQY